MSAGSLSLGLDLGTSGLRSAVLGADGRVVSMARAIYEGDPTSAEAWWSGALACLKAQGAALREAGIDAARVDRIGVDGTSGSMVLTDADLVPLGPVLMYNSKGFEAEAEVISRHAPDPHIARGANSALARAMRLVAQDGTGRAAHLLHQADFIAARLMGRGGLSDVNNALKTGVDPETGDWPDWIGAVIAPELLPQPLQPGAPFGPISADIAEGLGLSPKAQVHAGTTDSIAAFLAAAPLKLGSAVTSLGTTLAVKLLSPSRIDVPQMGLYAHRLGGHWLVGGASNTGGGVLKAVLPGADLAALSARIDPAVESPLDYYPLAAPGERFPINDPDLSPRMEPRPDDDAAFLHGLLESMARIEQQCYAAIAGQGGGWPEHLVTAGGGAANATWTAIRERVLGRKIHASAETEAAIGTARLIQGG